MVDRPVESNDTSKLGPVWSRLPQPLAPYLDETIHSYINRVARELHLPLPHLLSIIDYRRGTLPRRPRPADRVFERLGFLTHQDPDTIRHRLTMFDHKPRQRVRRGFNNCNCPRCLRHRNGAILSTSEKRTFICGIGRCWSGSQRSSTPVGASIDDDYVRAHTHLLRWSSRRASDQSLALDVAQRLITGLRASPTVAGATVRRLHVDRHERLGRSIDQSGFYTAFPEIAGLASFVMTNEAAFIAADFRDDDSSQADLSSVQIQRLHQMLGIYVTPLCAALRHHENTAISLGRQALLDYFSAHRYLARGTAARGARMVRSERSLQASPDEYRAASHLISAATAEWSRTRGTLADFRRILKRLEITTGGAPSSALAFEALFGSHSQSGVRPLE